MLICFAIEKSFKTNKEIKINYKNTKFKLMKYPFGKPVFNSKDYLAEYKINTVFWKVGSWKVHG